MKIHSGLFDGQSLFENLCSVEILREGFRAVRKNKGSSGTDGQTIEAFEEKLDEELAQLREELVNWSYKPQPVRGVEIPKPGTNELRLLGIPCVRDRTVQATMKLLLEPILEPLFSKHSYGFRPGRNQEQAVNAAIALVKEGKEFVADIDLSKFFDRVGHDRLVSRLSQIITDKKILRLIGMTLRSGIMKDGVVTVSKEGTVQGSPLSPILSNFVLDELDRELEKRGLAYVRFADDCNIFVKTRKAAERVLASVSRFIETKLKLQVNREKSKASRSDKVRFLGITIVKQTLAISQKSLDRAMEKVKELIPRGSHLPIEKAIEKINLWFVGWANYYKMTQYPSQLHKIEAHIRRRLRARFAVQARRKRFLVRKLISMGIKKQLACKTVYTNKGPWVLSHTSAMEKAFSNRWFENVGLKTASDAKLEHWFGIRQWIKLT